MKYIKFFLFFFALGATCYIAYCSVQRNTLAPNQPLSTLTVAIIDTKKSQQGFISDVITDLAHRMTQKPKIHICSMTKALNDVKKGKIDCALIPKTSVSQKYNLLETPLVSAQTDYTFIVSEKNTFLSKRTYATLLEMLEDGSLEDFKHKWHLC